MRSKRAPNLRGPGRMRKTRILIVDDEASIRDALNKWFELCGYEVGLAGDGIEAIERFQDNEYDAVLMDLEMPRMGGIDAIPVLKQIQPHVPIVVLTGFPGNSRGVLECGAAKILQKPIHLRKLELQVRAVLGHTDPANG